MSHPVLQGMLMTGCQNQKDILMSFHTYMELCEVKLLWDVDYAFDSEFDLIYIKSKTSKDAENFNIYVPLSTSKTVTPGWINNLKDKLQKGIPNSELILVIKERDTSSVYYKISKGLVQPICPEMAKIKKSTEEKNKYFESELKKMRLNLFEEAKKEGSILPNEDSPNNSNSKQTDVNRESSTESSNKKDKNVCKENDQINISDDIMIIDDNDDDDIEIIEL